MATLLFRQNRSTLLPGVRAYPIQGSSTPAFLPSSNIGGNGPMGGVRHNTGRLKELKNRIKTSGAVAKITKSLKLIASARMRPAVDRMENSRPFAEGPLKPFQYLHEKGEEDKKDQKKAEAAPAGGAAAGGAAATKPRHIVITMTSDRGLCGALNGQAVRYSVDLAKSHSASDVKFMTIGDKGVQLMSRQQGDKILLSWLNTSKKPLNFLGVGHIVDRLLAVDDKFDSVSVVYNKFVNRVMFKTTNQDFVGPKVLQANSQPYAAFEWQEEGRIHQLRDLFEFSLASFLYNAYMENSASELSSRMTSMEGATKNANEMVKKLTQLYNRGRQAGITTELIEITVGAEAIKASKATL